MDEVWDSQVQPCKLDQNQATLVRIGLKGGKSATSVVNNWWYCWRLARHFTILAQSQSEFASFESTSKIAVLVVLVGLMCVTIMDDWPKCKLQATVLVFLLKISTTPTPTFTSKASITSSWGICTWRGLLPPICFGFPWHYHPTTPPLEDTTPNVHLLSNVSLLFLVKILFSLPPSSNFTSLIPLSIAW